MNFLFMFYDRPNYHGGPIVNARRLLPELHRRGHDVRCLLFYGGDGAPSSGYLEKQGIRCYTRPLRGYTETHVQWILRRVADLRPDIFIPNLLVSGWFAARWVREAGIPTVAVMRSDERFYWEMVDQFVAGPREWAVSGLVCVSEGLCREVQRKTPEHTRLCVIPSGVPVSPDKRPKNRFQGAVKLVYAGRLVQEQKRILDLVDSLAMIMRERDNIHVTLIGDGEQRPLVEQRIESHGVKERFTLVGTVPSETIQNTLAGHDMLVLLSDYEGTPGAVMDGMAAGLVPVCLDIPGGVRELVIHEHTGLLVKNRQKDFARAIGRLMADEALRQRLAANAKAHIKKHFSLEIAADRWESFAAELVSEASSPSRVVVPQRLSLPPVLPVLSREDRRRPSLPQRVFRRAVRLLRRLNFHNV